MADVTINAGTDDIWSSETQAKIRATETGDTITLVGNFTLRDQFQILGGATTLDLTGCNIEVAPLEGQTACLLLRNTDGQPRKETLWVKAKGCEITYNPGAKANPATAVLYIIDIPNVRVDGLTIKDVDQCNGIVVEARSEIVSPVFTNCSVKFKDGSDYAHSEHVAWRFKSKLLFATDTNNQNDSTRAGRIAGPSGHAQVEYLYLTNCTAEGGYYGFDLSGVVRGRILNCVVSNNMRGMSLQDKTYAVSVEHCRVYENESAGIHLAYGSEYCLIANCLVWSTRATGEALMQAYVGTKSNTFRNNAVFSSGNPTHAFQGALGEFLWVENCTARVSSVAHAVVASEAQWDTNVNGTWHSRSRAAANQNGLNQNLDNYVSVKNSTLLLESGIPLMSVTSAVLADGQGKATTKFDNATLAQPGLSQLVRVQAKDGQTLPMPGGMHGPIPQEAGGSMNIVVTGRTGNDFETRATGLHRFGFKPVGGGTPAPQPPTHQPGPTPQPQPPTPQPQPPTPPAPGISEESTLAGLKGTNLVAVITYPEEAGIQTRQWADWVAFFEVTDGEVTKWPDNITVPQWSGSRGFPAVILPKNGTVKAEWKNLTRTFVELDGGLGYVGSHSSISGVQWYARGPGMKIANPAIAKDRLTGKAVEVTENPSNYEGTVGSIAPSGYATYVWVSDLAKGVFQFVAIRNGEAVPIPAGDFFTKSITFTDPKNFPCIVWDGEGFPNDATLRDMTITWATVPVEYSGKAGPHTAGSKLSLANPRKSQRKLNATTTVDVAEATVTAWFPKKPGSNADAGAPDNSLGGSNRERVERAIQGVQVGHHFGNYYPIPWFTSPGVRRSGAPVVGQGIGGSVVMGAAKSYREMQGTTLWNENMDGSETAASMRAVADRKFNQYNTWFCGLACTGWTFNPNAMYQIRRAKIYVLPKGQNRYVKVYDESGTGALGTWANDYMWNMSGNPVTQLPGYTAGRPSLVASRSGGIASIKVATRPELVSHGGSNDVTVPGLINYDYDGIVVEYEARLHPDWTHAKIALQMGMDAKIEGHTPPSNWYVGMGLSNLRLLTKDWQTFAWCNAKSGQDSGRGGIACDDSRLLNATFPD